MIAPRAAMEGTSTSCRRASRSDSDDGQSSTGLLGGCGVVLSTEMISSVDQAELALGVLHQAEFVPDPPNDVALEISPLDHTEPSDKLVTGPLNHNAPELDPFDDIQLSLNQFPEMLLLKPFHTQVLSIHCQPFQSLLSYPSQTHVLSVHCH